MQWRRKVVKLHVFMDRTVRDIKDATALQGIAEFVVKKVRYSDKIYINIYTSLALVNFFLAYVCMYVCNNIELKLIIEIGKGIIKKESMHEK